MTTKKTGPAAAKTVSTKKTTAKAAKQATTTTTKKSPAAKSTTTKKAVANTPLAETVAPAKPQVRILDGSMGRELCNRGLPEDDLFRKVWSARALLDPEFNKTVVEAHRDFIDNGAEMVTTCNYGVQPHYFGKVYEATEVEGKISEYTLLAARLAAQAVQESGKTVRVLGSLPPLYESHRPDLAAKFLKETGAAEVTRIYDIVARALVEGGVHAFLIETMNSWEEAMCAIEAVKSLGLPILLSLEGSLRDESLNPQPELGEEMVRRVIALKEGGVAIEAFGFNCAPPEDIRAVLTVIDRSGLRPALEAANIELISYANCNDRKATLDGKGFDASNVKKGDVRVRADLADKDWSGFAAFAEEFQDLGATYIGGCCGCRPAGINMLCKWVKPCEHGELEKA
jgi:S-methylmethionine-dependent homocysteine/selenocysteine methylase